MMDDKLKIVRLYHEVEPGKSVIIAYFQEVRIGNTVEYKVHICPPLTPPEEIIPAAKSQAEARTRIKEIIIQNMENRVQDDLFFEERTEEISPELMEAYEQDKGNTISIEESARRFKEQLLENGIEI